MSDRVRVGLIGAGHIVNQRYLTGYQQVPEAEVVAIAPIQPTTGRPDWPGGGASPARSWTTGRCWRLRRL